MKKLIILSLLLISCTHEREIDSIVLDVPYPAQQSLVQGGYCLYGAFWIVSNYLHPGQMLHTGQAAPSVTAGERIAQEYFGLSVRFEWLRFYQLEQELWAGRPVVLVFRGDKGIYSDAVVLVGILPEGAVIHYPVWSWPGSGAYVFVEWDRFYELYTGWGYRLL